MSRYIPPEEMNEAQIREQLDAEYKHWDDLKKNGCSDPAWPDGVNLNLVRNHIMDCLPPASMRSDCSQLGEPYSTRFDPESGNWRSTYATFKRVSGAFPNGIWQYCGHCFRGENVERGKDLQVCKIS